MKVITVRDTGTDVWAAVTVSEENWQKIAEQDSFLAELVQFFEYKQKIARDREEFQEQLKRERDESETAQGGAQALRG